MKKSASQIFFALVCAILGFLLAYQFKVIMQKNQVTTESTYDKNQIVSEVDSLKKEKEELTKSNAELSERIKKIEEAAASSGEVEKEVKKLLDNSRLQIGTVDVTGPGVIVTLTPKSSIFANTDFDKALDEQELVHLVNLLLFSRAEAVSINDYRITPQTGIKNSSNYIWIGSAGKVSPKEKIVIKAIGDKAKLQVAMNFPGAIAYMSLNNYDITVDTADDIIIPKSNQSIRSDFIKPVKE